MADFKFFTLGVGITVIVLGAAGGAAIGAVSGGSPSPTPAKTAMSHMTSPAKLNAKKRGMTPAASAASRMGSSAMPMVGKTDMGAPGVLRLSGMPTGAVRVWRNPQGMLEVRLAAYGLTPGSSHNVSAYGLAPGTHAAHIHLGSCQQQGAVKYMLMDFTANAGGNIVNQTRTVRPVSPAPPRTGWYLNLHLGNGGDVLANGRPTLNFRPELCSDVTGVATSHG